MEKFGIAKFKRDISFSVFLKSIIQYANDFDLKIIMMFIISLMQSLSQRAQTIRYQKEMGKSFCFFFFLQASGFLHSRNTIGHKFMDRQKI